MHMQTFPRTSAGGLSLIPLRVAGIRALDDNRALLQGVSGVTGELHDRAHSVGAVSGGEVAVLDEWLVAVPCCKSWEDTP